MDRITVRKANAGDMHHVFSIRRNVFVEEQHCPPELEYANEEESVHFIAFYDDEPCGAARWRKTNNGIKLERFAVLPAYRGKKVGTHLVEAVLFDLPAGSGRVYLNAQVSAVDFYLKLGFEPVGDLFEEAGIMHRQMQLSSGKKMSAR
jgi:predicted GNAT family N-acyltransferase